MKHSLPILAIAAIASIPTPGHSAATRNFGITGFDRVRIDGPYDVRLTVGVPPFARAVGAKSSALDSVSIRVEGRTLVIRKTEAWSSGDGDNGPAMIELGTHELSAAWVNGAGSVQINKVKSATFDISVVGAGAARVDSAEVDELKATLAGSGTIRIAGKTNKLFTTVRGTSSLAGDDMVAKEAVIGAEGPSLVRLTVTESAKIDAVGLTSVQLQGRPGCVVKSQGSASVIGCR
nr:DUF2807 domain-containing protein [uncultured Sphingomonas sp.]